MLDLKHVHVYSTTHIWVLQKSGTYAYKMTSYALSPSSIYVDKNRLGDFIYLETFMPRFEMTVLTVHFNVQ